MRQRRRSNRTQPRKYGRWADFEEQVMRAVDPTLQIMNVVEGRQLEIDDDDQSAELVREQFCIELRRRGHDATWNHIFIPSAVAAQWYCSALNERRATNVATKAIAMLGIRELRKSKRRGAPGWRWMGVNSTATTAMELRPLPDPERPLGVPSGEVRGQVSRSPQPLTRE